MASKLYSVKVLEGGRLVTSYSLETIGEKNWSRKLNMRRVSRDSEGRCEGWQKFLGSTQYVFDGTESVMQLAELVRPNGDRVIVGASRSKIKRYDVDSGTWTDISGGLTFSAQGKRWQTCTINGYLILNNGVDLPVSFRVEDPYVFPIYELRQQGYARVGRICEYNGFLMIADLSKIKSYQLDAWMFGYGNFVTTSTVAKSADWTIAYSGDHRKQFNVTTGASAVVVTLPTLTANQRPFYFWIAKVDAGAGSVTTTPAIADEAVVLSAINDSALIWWNGSRWVAKVFAGGVIPGFAAYGTPPSSIVERFPWAVANSEFGEPTHWAPAFSAYMPAASTTINLPFAPLTWVAGVTRVAVIGGGPAGATLGGQTGYEDGILITAIGTADPATGAVPITLELTTQTGITYPRTVTVTRWTDISTIVAEYRLVGDSSEIIGMQPLMDSLILYRTTSIYVGRYTGRADKPFIFSPRYPGKKQSLNLPLWGDAIADSNGESHIYPGVGGRFYEFDGVSWPTIHAVCDDAREMFFNGVLNTDEVFVCANPNTKQFYWCSPQRVFAYDFEYRTVSEIDAVFGAGSYVWKPGGTDRWMILGIGRFVYVYGLVTNAATNIRTYLRDGVVPTAVLKSGLIDGLYPSGEKDLMSYCPVMSSQSPDVAFQVQLLSTHNPSAAPVALMTPPENLPTPAGESFFTTAYRALYFQDQITLTDTRDLDFRISSRIFELDAVGYGQGIPRRVT